MDNVTTVLAWWGAAISTAVLVWDVYKWRRTGRAKLIVRANGYLQDARSSNPQKYIVIKVTNIGDKAKTLGLVAYRYYKSKPGKWRKEKAEQRGFFNPGNSTSPLPYKFEVGTEWSCVIEQTTEIEKMSEEGYFFIEAEDSSTRDALKNFRTRLLLS